MLYRSSERRGCASPLGWRGEVDMSIEDRLRDARVQAFLTGSRPTVETDDELDALVARTAEVYARSVTDRTRATYARRWVLFESWCAEYGLAALPAAPETAMLYLTDAI